MKKSIFARTFAIILITMLFIQLIAFIVVSFCSESIYYSSKLKDAQETAGEIKDYFNEEDGNFGELIVFLEEISIESGARITLVDQDGFMLYGRGISAEFGGANHEDVIPVEMIELKNGEHLIFEFKNNNGNVTQYMYGERFDNGILAIVGIPLKAITDTVMVIKTILAFIILIATIISIDSSYILSKSITSPLLNLNYIAREIGKFNFKVRYQGHREDEFGELGDTLNELSEQLEANITGLKNELEKEKTMEALRKQFIAQASHEMQTPIAIISSYMEAIEDDIVESEEERQQYFGVIREETKKMSRMVKSMLDLSQIESGTFSIKKEYFDIYAMLEMVALKYKGLAEKQAVQFIYQDSLDKEFIVYGDEYRLEQVLTNFITNALKHTKQDKRVILACSEENDSMRISVWNEGDPIREEDLPYIWESFYKAKTLAGENGTGLGLAIAKNILLLHKYEFGVNNEDGGVNFWFDVIRNEEE